MAKAEVCKTSIIGSIPIAAFSFPTNSPAHTVIPRSLRRGISSFAHCPGKRKTGWAARAEIPPPGVVGMTGAHPQDEARRMRNSPHNRHET